MEERFRYRHVHAIAGTFVFIAIVVFVAVVVFAGRSQRWFIRDVTVQIVLPEAGAAGIRQGSEVYFLGTLVGSVSDVRADATGQMEAWMTIRRDFFRFVRTDSTAVINKKFGVGDSFFEIRRGQGEPLPEKNARIICEKQPPSSLETMAEDIHREALPVLQKFSAGLDTWTAMGSNLITTQKRLDQLLLRVDNMAVDLQQGKGTVGELLSDPAVADQLKTLMINANRSLEDLQVTLKNLQSTSTNLQIASTNLPAISSTLGKETKDLPGLTRQTQITMRELERLIEAMQRTWLLRKHVNKTNPPPINPYPISPGAK